MMNRSERAHLLAVVNADLLVFHAPSTLRMLADAIESKQIVVALGGGVQSSMSQRGVTDLTVTLKLAIPHGGE